MKQPLDNLPHKNVNQRELSYKCLELGGLIDVSCANSSWLFSFASLRVELAGCVISFSGDMSGHLGAFPDFGKGSDILVAHHAVAENVTGVSRNRGGGNLLLTHLIKRSLNC